MSLWWIVRQIFNTLFEALDEFYGSINTNTPPDWSDVADDKLVFGAFLDVFGVQLKDALFFLFCLPNARTHKHTPRWFIARRV